MYICSSNPQRRHVPKAVPFIFHWNIFSLKCDSLHIARSGVDSYPTSDRDRSWEFGVPRLFEYILKFVEINTKINFYNSLVYYLTNRHSAVHHASGNFTYFHSIFWQNLVCFPFFPSHSTTFFRTSGFLRCNKFRLYMATRRHTSKEWRTDR